MYGFRRATSQFYIKDRVTVLRNLLCSGYIFDVHSQAATRTMHLAFILIIHLTRAGDSDNFVLKTFTRLSNI